MVSYTWFKLLLDERAILTEHDDKHLKDAIGKGTIKLPPGKTAVDVTADYLREFRKLIFRELEKPMTKEVLDKTPIDFYVTVPAIWDDIAKDQTTRAVKQAGFLDRVRDNFTLMSEPEAAAVAALTTTYERYGGVVEASSRRESTKLAERVADETHLQKGLIALIVDGGGGTVDLEAMKVVDVNPLKLRNVCVGYGLHKILNIVAYG